VLASIGSGTVGIIMAYRGYGVWSLVMKTLTGVALTSLLLWLWNQWKPSLEFSWNSFKEMFSFGSKLLLSGLIYTAFQNVYLLIIGKYFSATDLGFYSRADQFNTVVSSNITGVIQRVSYPVLSSIQNDKHRLKAAYQKLIKSIMLITFLSMIGLAAIAKPLVLTLVGKQWLPSVIYLQLLCFVGMFFPLHAINLDMLKVQGRSDLFLKLEIIKTIMTVPVVVIAVFLGIKIMIVGMIFVTILAYFLNSYYSGMYLGYSSIQQLKDILPSFFLAVFVGSIVFVSGILLKTSPLVTLIIQVLIGILLTICIVEFLKTEDYIFIKQIIIDKFFKEK
jgi:O-antigen/teichoic acid export membrane protein